MTERKILTRATITDDGRPLVEVLIPADDGGGDHVLQLGPVGARRIAAAMIETAADAESLVSVKPAGPIN